MHVTCISNMYYRSSGDVLLLPCPTCTSREMLVSKVTLLSDCSAYLPFYFYFYRVSDTAFSFSPLFGRMQQGKQATAISTAIIGPSPNKAKHIWVFYARLFCPSSGPIACQSSLGAHCIYRYVIRGLMSRSQGWKGPDFEAVCQTSNWSPGPMVRRLTTNQGSKSGDCRFESGGDQAPSDRCAFC